MRDRLVLLALAAHADDVGLCWPAYTRMEALSGVPRRFIRSTLDRLYLGESMYFREIDLGVIQVQGDRAVVFVRPSGHPPGRWSETRDPGGHGPFQQVQISSLISPTEGALKRAAEWLGNITAADKTRRR